MELILRTVNSEQVAELAEHAHVYMTKDGRISMAGLNEHNVKVSGVFGLLLSYADHATQYFAESMSKSVKGELKAKSSL